MYTVEKKLGHPDLGKWVTLYEGNSFLEAENTFDATWNYYYDTDLPVRLSLSKDGQGLRYWKSNAKES